MYRIGEKTGTLGIVYGGYAFVKYLVPKALPLKPLGAGYASRFRMRKWARGPDRISREKKMEQQSTDMTSPLISHAKPSRRRADKGQVIADGVTPPPPASIPTAFRLRPDARDALFTRAKEAGMSPRAWLEQAILENKTRIVVNTSAQDLVFQINKAGNNLNQIAHAIHTLRLKDMLAAGHYTQHMETLRAIEGLLTDALAHARSNLVR